MNFNIELPINTTSFGQISFGILNELFGRKLMPNIFPIGNVDLSPFDVNQNFVSWLEYCIRKAKKSYSREVPTIKFWHLIDSDRTISKRNILYTFHETDQLTLSEANIVKNTDVVLFSSNYSVSVAKEAGLTNVDVCHPYLDSVHVFKRDTPPIDAVSFSLIGKFEKRKHTERILKIWNKLFADNPKYRLNCLITNQFIDPEKIGEQISEAFNKKIPWNVNILPRFKKNDQVNFVMNNSDIDLSGLSGAEGFNLPCFNMLALDKISVVLNAHAHTDFIENTNAVLVEPCGKIPIYDGVFFSQGGLSNQGNMYDFKDEDAEKAIIQAVEKNNSAEKLSSDLNSRFSVSNTVEKLLSYI